MSNAMQHICICICTYKRPQLLLKLLGEIERQATESMFTYSVVIVDNDRNLSAKEAVKTFQCTAHLPITYVCEPEQNIALARNRAIENSKGDFVAFIDDDEHPVSHWLLNLLSACMKYGVEGALGPVIPHFAKDPPIWIIDGKICDRPTYPTGTELHWDYMRTGNVLIRRDVFRDPTHRFRREYGRSGGEDGDFFRRVCERGARFVWCHEAAVYETISEDRWLASYYLKRSMRIGGLNGEKAVGDPSKMIKRLPKSLIGAIGLLLISPATFFMKKHLRMRILMKLAYEVGWLLGLLGCVFFRVRED